MYITAKVPISETGTATLGNQRRTCVAQEHEHHEDHQHDRDNQRPLHVIDRSADRRCPVHAPPSCRFPAESRPSAKEAALRIAIHRLDNIRARLAEDDQHDRRACRSDSRAARTFCTESITSATSDKPHRCAVLDSQRSAACSRRHARSGRWPQCLPSCCRSQNCPAQDRSSAGSAPTADSPSSARSWPTGSDSPPRAPTAARRHPTTHLPHALDLRQLLLA